MLSFVILHLDVLVQYYYQDLSFIYVHCSIFRIKLLQAVSYLKCNLFSNQFRF